MRSSLCILAILGAVSAQAGALEGNRTIALEDAQGTRTVIGSVSFMPTDSGIAYEIAAEDAVYANHFLSMRPFKCLESPEKHWCYVPYPYEIRRVVTPDDLTDLEYDLLFLWKGATEYGINMWNGVYYKLEVDGDRLVGQLHEMDMNLLSAPPPAGELRPLSEGDLHESDPDSHWLPVVVID
ncbi:hypothetical protein [Falsiphaeobacter marinintestinus]|uniref:hypothetical protein n=1 Tax=Falsiphaeobacter marinintestinus TaxID=1492905 RepID=UPI0011B7591A|nr:hypothetical protein [Phaeobacter marinintestinus]